jgi:integrase
MPDALAFGLFDLFGPSPFVVVDVAFDLLFGWDCVDFDRRIIRVRRRASYQNKMGSPKSKAGTRDVPMTPMVFNALRQWRLACPRSGELDLVFPDPDGNILWHSRVHWEWRRLLKKLDLDYRFHDLRHAAASLFIEQKWQPKKVQVVMGHSSIKTTLDVYGHLFESMEDDQEAMKQIEARIFG